MEKEIGKLYASISPLGNSMVILCTGYGLTEKRFSGVVLKQSDKFSDHRVGDYSDSWTWHPSVIEEYYGDIVLNNNNWKPRIKMGCTNG